MIEIRARQIDESETRFALPNRIHVTTCIAWRHESTGTSDRPASKTFSTRIQMSNPSFFHYSGRVTLLGVGQIHNLIYHDTPNVVRPVFARLQIGIGFPRPVQASPVIYSDGLTYGKHFGRAVSGLKYGDVSGYVRVYKLRFLGKKGIDG